MELKRILVGLDGSSRQPAVLAAALEMAERFDAELILCRTVGLPPEIPPEVWQSPEQTLEQFLWRRARAELERAAQILPESVRQRAVFEIPTATPWQGLCTVAQAREANLIVIGSHGYSGLDRLLGTTAARVVNHAPCSVFVVRAPPVAPR